MLDGIDDIPWHQLEECGEASWVVDVLKHLTSDQAGAALGALRASPPAGARAAADSADRWLRAR